MTISNPPFLSIQPSGRIDTCIFCIILLLLLLVICWLLLLPLQPFWMTTTMTDDDKHHHHSSKYLSYVIGLEVETPEGDQCQRSPQICISVACTILHAVNWVVLLYSVQWNNRVIVYVWQLSSFSARLVNGSSRRKSGPRTTEDLLGSMWNAVRSNNGIMVRWYYSVCQSCAFLICVVCYVPDCSMGHITNDTIHLWILIYNL